MKYRTIGIFHNETDKDMSLFLELSCEEVFLSPGQKVELLLEDDEKCFPVEILYHNDGLQIYPSYGNPEWLLIFNGKKIVPHGNTRLSEYK